MENLSAREGALDSVYSLHARAGRSRNKLEDGEVFGRSNSLRMSPKSVPTACSIAALVICGALLIPVDQATEDASDSDFRTFSEFPAFSAGEGRSSSQAPAVLGQQGLSAEQETIVEGQRQLWLDYEVALGSWIAAKEKGTTGLLHTSIENSFSETDAGSASEVATVVAVDAAGSTENPAVVSEPSPPPWVCFAEGTSADFVEAMGGGREIPAPSGISEAVTPLAFQYFPRARWSRTSLNTPNFFSRQLRRGDTTTLTWGIVPDGTQAPGLGNAPNGPSDLRARLDDLYGSESVWLPLFEQAFASWSEVAGIRYVYEAQDDGAALPNRSGEASLRPDIRIAGRALDGNFNTLAFNFGPDSGDMIIDTDDSFFANLRLNSRGLRNVIAHEHGHGLGFRHVCPVDRTKLMEPSLTRAFDGPQTDDIYTAQRQYGDPFEDGDLDSTPERNDTRGSAVDLGRVELADTTFEHLGLDDDSDEDYLLFNPTGGAGNLIRVTLRPVGDTYPEGGESQSTGCTLPTTSFAAGSVHDLRMEILSPGGTVLQSADATGPGEPEVIDFFDFPSGNIILRVSATTFTDRAQLYEVEMTVIDPDDLPEVSVAVSPTPEEAGTARFSLSLDESFFEEVSFDYSLEPGSAETPQDFVNESGTITFNPGMTNQFLDVRIINDLEPEIDESFSLSLSNPVFAVLPEEVVPLLILDDDAGALLLESVRIAPLGADPLGTVRWSAVPGRTYRVSFSEDLQEWQPLPGAESLVAAVSEESFTDPSPLAQRRFYQVEDLPAPN